MNIKNITRLFFILSLSILLFPNFAQAQNNLGLGGATITGTTLSLPINISSHDGSVEAFQFDLSYDSTSLTFTGSTIGSSASNFSIQSGKVGAGVPIGRDESRCACDRPSRRRCQRERLALLVCRLSRRGDRWRQRRRRGSAARRTADAVRQRRHTGMRYSNYSKIKKSDIINDFINVRDKKDNKKALSIPLNDESDLVPYTSERSKDRISTFYTPKEQEFLERESIVDSQKEIIFTEVIGIREAEEKWIEEQQNQYEILLELNQEEQEEDSDILEGTAETAELR